MSKEGRFPLLLPSSLLARYSIFPPVVPPFGLTSLSGHPMEAAGKPVVFRDGIRSPEQVVAVPRKRIAAVAAKARAAAAIAAPTRPGTHSMGSRVWLYAMAAIAALNCHVFCRL